MKILSLNRNDFGQVIAEVLNCGRVLKVFGSDKNSLIAQICKACYFTSWHEVEDDLNMNYPDFV